jgi:hypothetical protein
MPFVTSKSENMWLPTVALLPLPILIYLADKLI